MKTRISSQIIQADGVPAVGSAVISWPSFSLYGVAVAGGMKIIDLDETGQLTVDLAPCGAAVPPNTYYTVRYELDCGSVYEEYWVVPDITSATLEQVRVAFPVAPGIMISPTQITGLGAQPGQVLSWSGANWVGGWVNVANIDPNYLRFEVGTEGTDFNLSGSPVHLGGTLTLNLPDASPTARGVVTTGDQTFAGNKHFTGSVQIDGVFTVPGYVQTSRRIDTGAGLQGGGDLSADRVLSIVSDTMVQRINALRNGSLVGTRSQLNFLSGGAIALTVADNAAANAVDVTVSVGASTQTPWVAHIDGALFNLNNAGMIESKSGGFKFPDGTIQTTKSPSPIPQTPWFSHIDGAGFNLNNAANIGVGGIPMEKLHVRGGSRNYVRVDDSVNGCVSALASENGTGIVGTFSVHPFAVRVNNTNSIVIDPNGMAVSVYTLTDMRIRYSQDPGTYIMLQPSSATPFTALFGLWLSNNTWGTIQNPGSLKVDGSVTAPNIMATNLFNMYSANDVGATTPTRIPVETDSAGWLRWQSWGNFNALLLPQWSRIQGIPDVLINSVDRQVTFIHSGTGAFNCSLQVQNSNGSANVVAGILRISAQNASSGNCLFMCVSAASGELFRVHADGSIYMYIAGQTGNPKKIIADGNGFLKWQ